MHSHARTLLSKLGFADVDRKSPRHDLACSYLALRPSVLVAALQSAMPPGVIVESATAELEVPLTKGSGQYATTVGWVDVLAKFRAKLPSKMAAPSQFFLSGDEQKARDELLSAPRFNAHVSMVFCAILEVKIGHVGAGDLVRQMRLYDQYRPEFYPNSEFHTDAPGWLIRKSVGEGWDCRHCDPVNRAYFEHHREKAWEQLHRAVGRVSVACCDYEMDAEYVKTLSSAGVRTIRLGAGFEAFVREQAEEQRAVEVLAI